MSEHSGAEDIKEFEKIIPIYHKKISECKREIFFTYEIKRVSKNRKNLNYIKFLNYLIEAKRFNIEKLQENLTVFVKNFDAFCILRKDI